MFKIWIELSGIPAEGREFTFADQDFWKKCLETFDLKIVMARPLVAKATVLLQNNGAIVRGRLVGAVILLCDHCSEEFEQTLDERFEDFEGTAGQHDTKGEVRVHKVNGQLRLDIGAVLWEKFILALPENRCCKNDCKGLCHQCGANRNFSKCACSKFEDDPRLALFRNLKIS